MTRLLKPLISVARPLTLFLVLFVGSTQLANAGTLFECDLNAQRAKGWVSPKMSIVFEDNGAVTVVDGVILQFIGNPMPAKVIKRGDKARVTWNIANVTDNRGERAPTMRYVANLNTKTNTVAVTAKPVGYQERFSAKGMCKRRNK